MVFAISKLYPYLFFQHIWKFTIRSIFVYIKKRIQLQKYLGRLIESGSSSFIVFSHLGTQTNSLGELKSLECKASLLQSSPVPICISTRSQGKVEKQSQTSLFPKLGDGEKENPRVITVRVDTKVLALLHLPQALVVTC